jgi:hypothetical protein
MKERSLCLAVLLAGLSLMLGSVAAHAQATPTATPTPASCTITSINGSTPICATGAENPPAVLGVSIGNINSVTISKTTGAVNCCAGTMGALVQDSSDTPYILSTNHVLARNSGTKAAMIKEAIVQPGLQDIGCWQDPGDTAAQLSKWTPINFKGAENQLDAAIAKVVDESFGPAGPEVPGVMPDGEILNIGQISTTPFPFDSLLIGLPVIKMGRASCMTAGAIDAYDAFGVVTYPATCNAASSGVAFFNHQILVIGEIGGTVCSFASTGDSGSIVLTDDLSCPQAIGMVFAGASGAGADSGGDIVAVNPIQSILTKFNVTLVGQSCVGTPADAPVNPGPALRFSGMSDAFRASFEQVRSVKEAHRMRLIKIPGVAAIAIGAGATPDSAALKVYLTEDSPEIRNRVLSEVKGTIVTFKVIRERFQAL